jgi:nickel-dependent lactate racemase
MDVDLAYGTTGLRATVPDDALVVTPTDLPGLPDERGAVIDALRAPVAGPPLVDLVPRGARVAVVFPDLTRPMPNRTVLPPLLAELERLGAGPDEVELLCSTGTHRQATPEEMAALIGDDLVARYRVHDHSATESEHVEVGAVDGTPVLIDRRYVDADVRIVTGFVEPHFFAGFSGGPKAVCPGLAALDTILEAHSPRRIADPAATWTVTKGNPVHDFVRAACALAPPTLSVDVAINAARQLTAVFVGSLPAAHEQACAFVERTAVQRVPHRFDVVVSTNSGHPLDRNLYQAVKGMAAAERVVAPGGTIVMAAACADGVPDTGDFGRLLADARSADDLVDPTAPKHLDRWEAQVLGRVLHRARVLLRTDGLTDAQVRGAHLEPVPDVSDAVARVIADAGGSASVCVLPLGPLTVATVLDGQTG